MTQIKPGPAAACTAARHAGSNEAWRQGCRCPEALAAHNDWLERHRARGSNRLATPAVGADGVCRSELHGTVTAYQRHGCRCPEAVKAWCDDKHRRSNAKRRKRNIELAEAAWREHMRARRMTGDRLSEDPRKPWRGGRMAINRISLWMLIHGYPDNPTMGERIAAVAMLSQTWASVAWYEAPRRMNGDEIARRIGVSEGTAYRLRKKCAELAAGRDRRRLADRKWKDAVAAAAAGRADAERERHRACAADRAERQLEYAIRRYARARGESLTGDAPDGD